MGDTGLPSGLFDLPHDRVRQVGRGPIVEPHEVEVVRGREPSVNQEHPPGDTLEDIWRCKDEADVTSCGTDDRATVKATPAPADEGELPFRAAHRRAVVP